MLFLPNLQKHVHSPFFMFNLYIYNNFAKVDNSITSNNKVDVWQYCQRLRQHCIFPAWIKSPEKNITSNYNVVSTLGVHNIALYLQNVGFPVVPEAQAQEEKEAECGSFKGGRIRSQT